MVDLSNFLANVLSMGASARTARGGTAVPYNQMGAGERIGTALRDILTLGAYQRQREQDIAAQKKEKLDKENRELFLKQFKQNLTKGRLDIRKNRIGLRQSRVNLKQSKKEAQYKNQMADLELRTAQHKLDEATLELNTAIDKYNVYMDIPYKDKLEAALAKVHQAKADLDAKIQAVNERRAQTEAALRPPSPDEELQDHMGRLAKQVAAEHKKRFELMVKGIDMGPEASNEDKIKELSNIDDAVATSVATDYGLDKSTVEDIIKFGEDNPMVIGQMMADAKESAKKAKQQNDMIAGVPEGGALDFIKKFMEYSAKHKGDISHSAGVPWSSDDPRTQGIPNHVNIEKLIQLLANPATGNDTKNYLQRIGFKMPVYRHSRFSPDQTEEAKRTGLYPDLYPKPVGLLDAIIPYGLKTKWFPEPTATPMAPAPTLTSPFALMGPSDIMEPSYNIWDWSNGIIRTRP